MTTNQVTTAAGTKQAVTRAKLGMVALDATISVLHPTGNKQPGKIAERNYSLYSKIETKDGTIEPVTVGDYLKYYPPSGKQNPRTRARASLLWDLEHGFIAIPGYTREAIAAATKGG